MLGRTPAPDMGEPIYETARRNYEFFDKQAAKYRITFSVLGSIVLLGSAATAGGALSGLDSTYLAITSSAVLAAEALLLLFQVQNRYVGWRLAAETHRLNMETYNRLVEEGEIEAARKALQDLEDVRRQEVIEWAKGTMAARPNYLSE